MGYKNKNFGNQLEILRKKKKLTKEQLAEIVGISPQTIGRYIREGLIPGDDILDKLSELFKISKKDLLFPPEKPEDYDPTPLKHSPAIQEYTLIEKHREMVAKLVEILEGANKANADAIMQNLNAFHQTRDVTTPEILTMNESLLRSLDHKQWLMAGRPERRRKEQPIENGSGQNRRLKKHRYA